MDTYQLFGTARRAPYGLLLVVVGAHDLLKIVVFSGSVINKVRSFTPFQRNVLTVPIGQVCFGLAHDPAAWRQAGSVLPAAGHVAMATVVGCLFAALYLLSNNLLLVAGVHALINEPMPLILSQLDPALVILNVSCGVLVSWSSLANRFGWVFTLRTTPAIST
jgi:hypothetical protein